MPTTKPSSRMTRWHLKGEGYEFCNCDFGCGCNFGGFPNSKDGSCRAFVGSRITDGRCGEVSLSGVKCASILRSSEPLLHLGHAFCGLVA